MSETVCLGGIASSLCLSIAWPYYWTRQWGINGFPCLQHKLCKCDCGWVGENDHEFLGTSEEQEREAQAERARRTAFANRLVAERERQRTRGFIHRNPLDRLHVAGPGNIFTRGKHNAGVGGHPQEENLDDLVGGKKMREPQRGSLTEDSNGTGNDNISGTVGRTGSSPPKQEKAKRSIRAPVVPSSGIEGSEDMALNRGVMTGQTVVVSPPRQGRGQQPYTGTAPMRLSNDQETDEDTLVVGKSSTEGDASPSSKHGLASKFGFGRKDHEKDKDSQ